MARYDDGTNTVSYSLRINGDKQNTRQLTFTTAPDLKQLTEIKVWGREEANRIVVDRYEVVDPDIRRWPRQAQEGKIGAPPIPTTSMVMVMVDVGTGTGSVTVQTLTEDLFGADPSSLKNYYRKTRSVCTA